MKNTMDYIYIEPQASFESASKADLETLSDRDARGMSFLGVVGRALLRAERKRNRSKLESIGSSR